MSGLVEKSWRDLNAKHQRIRQRHGGLRHPRSGIGQPVEGTMTTLSEAPPASDLDMRVEDFLDDRLQSTADLDSLDMLVASIENQRYQLQSQLDDSIKELEEARTTVQDSQIALRDRIDDFNKLQQSIDVRAQIAAASDAPTEAIARLERPMQKRQMIDLAHKYLLLLQHIESLRSEARSHLPQSPKAALEPYSQLKHLAVELRHLQGVEHLNLVDHAETVTRHLWNDLKDIMSAEMDAVLSKRNWPRVDPQSQMDEEWITCFEKLLDLQMPEVLLSPGLVSLLPVDAMAKILVAEFRFHFLGDKPTSDLRLVSSHCFPWFLATIEKWEDFFRDNLGHLLSAKFCDTAVATKMAYLDPVCALVTAMLPVMRDKVQAVASEALEDPTFLSNFLSQLLALDDEIRTRFGYDGGDPDGGWPGLAADVLDHHFDTWFRVERKFALDRFRQIMESQEARKIDYDYAVTGKMKPTFAAVRVLDLLRAVTAKYERLRKLKHKARFLTDIQLDILDGYHDRLRGSLEAYRSMTSALGRTLHGVSKEQLAALEGTGALETLCKVIGSADRVSNSLSEWSDEEFFVVLWDDLQSRDAQRRSQDQRPGSASLDSILGRVPGAPDDGDAENGIFDETASAYTQRRKAAEELLMGALVDSHSKAFRAYLNQTRWTTVGETAVLDDTSHLSITPELDEPLLVLRRNLELLSRALSTASLRRVWHEALDRLQDMLWNGVLTRHSFTALGAAQLVHDMAALAGLVNRYLPGGPAVLQALGEGTRLLNLPASGEDAPGPSLKEASDRAFASNDEARALLEELGLDTLTPASARQVLERRVESGEIVDDGHHRRSEMRTMTHSQAKTVDLDASDEPDKGDATTQQGGMEADSVQLT